MRKALKYIIPVVLFFALFTVTFAVMTDNFDSYSNGDLNGQGTWSGSTTYDVQDSVVFAGAKAVNSLGNGVLITGTFAADADGSQIIYMRASGGMGNGDKHYTWFDAEDTARIGAVDINNNGGQYEAQIFNGSFTTIQNINANTWYKFEFEWDFATQKIRARVDDGTWTAWLTPENGWTTVDNVDFFMGRSGSQTAYWDDMSDGAATPTPTPDVGAGQQTEF